MFDMLKRSIAKHSGNRNSLKLLDVGCGTGLITARGAKLGLKVRGLDFSATALKKAKKLGLDVVQCDLDEGIPEKNASYDVVWAGDIVEHVFDPINLLKEVYRVLKPGGILLLTIPNDVGLISRLKMLWGISHQEMMYRKAGYYKHHTFFSPSLITFMLDRAGLNIEELRKILIVGSYHLPIRVLPSAFFTEMVFRAVKPEDDMIRQLIFF